MQPKFFDNAAQLAVLRVDWRFRKGWESLAEVRMLDLPDVSQRRRGALAAIYRYIGKNMKVGVGYNFTDFSDDLTDLRYDHKGVFVNFIVPSDARGGFAPLTLKRWSTHRRGGVWSASRRQLRIRDAFRQRNVACVQWTRPANGPNVRSFPRPCTPTVP